LVKKKFHITRARRSKRLAKDAPLKHAIPKRVRHANTNTLAEFSKQQSLLRVNTRFKKKSTKLIDPLKTNPKLIDVISLLLIDLALLSSPLIVRKSFVEINSLLVQVLKNKTKTPLLFNLIIK
jgi:hypothetical protein